MVSAKRTCLRPPSASASAATDVLETAVSDGSMTSVRAKVALRSPRSHARNHATAVAFADSLHHSGRLRFGWLEGISHNAIVLLVGEVFALVVSGYSGVLLSVTNQGVWSDTFLMGALFICFSELSGMAVAAIVSDRWGNAVTAAAVRRALFGFAAVSAVFLVIFLVGLATQQDGSLAALIASLHELVAPAFWIGAVGLGLLVPLLALSPRRIIRVPDGSLALIGVLVLVGVLAFRYAMFFSAISFVQS